VASTALGTFPRILKEFFNMSLRLTAVTLVALAGASTSLGDTYVVPPAYENVIGTSTFLGPYSISARTYQLLIHADELVGLVGADLSGLAFRLPASATATWPAADLIYQNYDIYLSPSVAPAERSLTFALNIAGPQVQVRAGVLTIPAESHTFGGSPNVFGPAITFDVPYTYSGGHLLVEIRQSGATGTSRSVDALSSSTAGYATQFSAAWTGSYTGATASQGNFSVIQFTTGGSSLCYANCDASTVEPVLNVDDFTCFINEFAQAQTLPHEQQVTAYANCDQSTIAPALNVDDFTCFINQFAQGCP
jgi:hypothetical protein